MQQIRKELRKLDQETKKDGGVVDWNKMLNDMMQFLNFQIYLKPI